MMIETSSNKIVYLSPLNTQGITDIKKTCLFFDKVFVPVSLTSMILSLLVVQDDGDKWKASIDRLEYKEMEKNILKDFEPLIKEGIIETDTASDFNLLDKLKISLEKVHENEKERLARRRYLGIKNGRDIIQQSRLKVLSQIDLYNDILAPLGYTPCFNDPLALDTLSRCLNFYENYEDTSAILTDIKRELGIKRDILTLNVVGENFPDLGFLDSKQILKVRNKLEKELNHFRVEMEKYCIEIMSFPYSNDFNKDIQKIVKGKINPLIVELRNEIKTTKNKFLLDLVNNIPSVKTWTSLGFSIYSGLPISVAIGIASGVVFITTLTKQKLKLKEIKRKNGLGIFLSVRS